MFNISNNNLIIIGLIILSLIIIWQYSNENFGNTPTYGVCSNNNDCADNYCRFIDNDENNGGYCTPKANLQCDSDQTWVNNGTLPTDPTTARLICKNKNKVVKKSEISCPPCGNDDVYPIYDESTKTWYCDSC